MDDHVFKAIEKNLQQIPETTDLIFFYGKMTEIYFIYCRLIISDGSPALFLAFVQDCHRRCPRIRLLSSKFESIGDIKKQVEWYRDFTKRCGAMLVEHTGNFFVVSRGFVKGSRWQIPVGKLQSAAEGAFACAKRELKEELGYSLHDDTQTQVLQEDLYHIFLERGVPLDTIFQPEVEYETAEVA